MFVLLASLAASYLATLTLYRLLFHPLHRYPGPALAALTNWYGKYYSLVEGGQLVYKIEKLHELYGPVIRIGPNTLHFNDRRAYHDIYTHGSSLTKEPRFYHGFGAHARQSSLAFCEPQDSKNRRSLLAPLFSRQAIIKLEYAVQTKVDQLIDILEEHYGSPESSVKMSVAYRSLTTDIITDYCFSDSANVLADWKFSHPIVQSTRDRIRRMWIQIYFPFLIDLVMSAPQKILLCLFPDFRSFVEMHERYERQIDRYISNPEEMSTADHETIYHHLLSPKDPKMRPSKTSLIHEAFMLVAAGSETVASTCTVGTYYALQEPSIRLRLTEELREAWPDKGRPLSFTALEKLPYLTAVIKESLRMAIGPIHPLPRVVGRETPEIGGLRLPPGTIVETSTFFMHTNPEVFNDPLIFNPERWLVKDTSEMMLDFVPFSKGPRQCIALNLAWSELYLILGNIFRKLEIKPVKENAQADMTLGKILDYVAPLWEKSHYEVFVNQVKD
ncbi:hypothetical protein D9757_000365 [Collybiopsis confluens]|uniref:Cytochrome P450 n=1 Tax=Collybiopsis confluens TaxID=2823264 RepID=A0A8H5MH20_9AGAR|nr:hypothetical protein D9757_000365 [Collybiopsis confluens]